MTTVHNGYVGARKRLRAVDEAVLAADLARISRSLRDRHLLRQLERIAVSCERMAAALETLLAASRTAPW